MYSLTNFLAVLWYTMLGWFGIGRDTAHTVTLYNGADEAACSYEATDIHVASQSLNLPGSTGDGWAGWCAGDPSRNAGPYATAADAVANGGAGVKIGNLYL
ncbi:hypothetical protein [Ideonella sp. YS5]|uniref:hypothetical protein n=1 Tax=Ideonella sp. YS5 TaxID=3453714 RepID=UPI003EE8418F